MTAPGGEIARREITTPPGSPVKGLPLAPLLGLGGILIMVVVGLDELLEVIFNGVTLGVGFSYILSYRRFTTPLS